MKYLFIDTETTGLIAGVHSVIQIGCVIDDEEYTFNMQPFDGAVIDDKALAVNKLTREKLAEFDPYPKGVDKFLGLLDAKVNKFDKSDKLFFVGYNTPFDEGFIRKMIGKYFGSYFWWPSIDVAVLAAHHLRDKRHTLPNFKLNSVYQFLRGVEIQDAHDALADIKATKEIYDIVTGGKDAEG